MAILFSLACAGFSPAIAPGLPASNI